MRLKAEAILDFGPDDAQQQNKIVREYRDQYKAISDILNEHPQILEMAHRGSECVNSFETATYRISCGAG